mgnify:CR=1 FL=1
MKIGFRINSKSNINHRYSFLVCYVEFFHAIVTAVKIRCIKQYYNFRINQFMAQIILKIHTFFYRVCIKKWIELSFNKFTM